MMRVMDCSKTDLDLNLELLITYQVQIVSQLASSILY